MGDLAPVARGEQGTVWRLDTDLGSYAIKEPFEPQTEADASADVAYQEAVLASSKVPMPSPMWTSSGSVLATVEGRQLRAYEWVDLLPSDADSDPALVGRTVAAIHQVRHQPARPLHPWYVDPVGASVWREISRRISADNAPFADAFEAEVPVLIELEGLIEQPRSLQNCHRDLFADNILPMAHGGICVIDWENCGLEDPSHELCVVMFDFTAGNRGRPSQLYDAYVDAGGPGRVSGRGDFSMLIAQFGHFHESAAKEWLHPTSSEDERAHAMGRFEELFRAHLTVELIDELLDAVAR